MKTYILSIVDDDKASQLFTVLNDLSYVKISEQTGKSTPRKKFPIMDNPVRVKNFKRHSRDELHER